jgi:ABC-type molybdenum transport system ATPase subunit/photorepair protein PhrA
MKMYTHAIMWKILESPLSKKETANKIKELLLSLNGKIPGLVSIEVGINSLEGENTFDVVFIGKFESKKSYEEYSKHPEHEKIVPFFKELKLERTIVDY